MPPEPAMAVVIGGLSPPISCRYNSFCFNVGQFLQFLLNLVQYGFCAMFRFFGHEARGILTPWSGVQPSPPALKGKVFNAGLPGKPTGVLLTQQTASFLVYTSTRVCRCTQDTCISPKLFWCPFIVYPSIDSSLRQPLICSLVTID